MMTDAETFHRFTLRYGGRMDRNIPSGTAAELVYSEIETIATGLISSARQHVPSLPKIHFDYVHNGEVNAYAFKTDGRYFVGLTTGTLYMLQLVFDRMLADRDLFPAYGNPKDEVSELPLLKGYVPHAQRMCDTGHRPAIPRSRPRLLYSYNLLLQSVLFLIGHEIAHISRGHVDYWHSMVGTPLVAELTADKYSSDLAIERQAIEVDADRRSIFAAVASLELTAVNTDSVLHPWTPSSRSLEDMISDWAFAVNSLFRLFGDIRFSAEDLTTSTHPPLPARRAIGRAAAYLAFALRDPTPARKQLVLKSLDDGGAYCELAFAKILGVDIAAEGYSCALGPQGKEYHDRLMACWFGGLRDRVLAFAYEPDREQTAETDI